MGWRDLLAKNDDTIVSPWVGGRSLRSNGREWVLEGPLPTEYGWHEFRPIGRKAKWHAPHSEEPEKLQQIVSGYLVGDHILSDHVRVDPDPSQIVKHAERVFLVELGLDRFVRVEAGRSFENGPLIYKGEQMPLGPEEEVLSAYLDNKSSVDGVKNVSPALDSAFRLETWRRAEAERRRAEGEQRRREEEERRVREEHRRQLYARLGDGAARRELAQTDFAGAARSALAVSGAEYLDHRPSRARNEIIVRFRFQHQRFECTCDKDTLQIIDSGICLRDESTGERGDDRFSLESLPTVIAQAIRERRLVIFRHAD